MMSALAVARKQMSRAEKFSSASIPSWYQVMYFLQNKDKRGTDASTASSNLESETWCMKTQASKESCPEPGAEVFSMFDGTLSWCSRVLRRRPVRAKE